MSAHSIPLVPFSGRMSYCLIRSLKMVLEFRGQTYPTPWLECVSGEPFGFVYIREPGNLFAIDGYAYHLAGQNAKAVEMFKNVQGTDGAAALARLWVIKLARQG